MRSQNARVRRILQIVKLLQSGSGLTSAELARLLDVSRRTVFREIAVLRDSGLELACYPEGGYFLPTTSRVLQLTPDVAEVRRLAILLTECAAPSAEVHSTASANQNALNVISGLPSQLRERLIGFAQHVALWREHRLEGCSDYKTLDILLGAAVERRRVRIRFQSRPAVDPVTTVLHPYRLLLKDATWYAVGRSTLHRAVGLFRVADLNEAELLDEHFKIPPRFSVSRFLSRFSEQSEGAKT